MALPDSYTLKPNAIPAYFDAILDAHPPERFSVKFLKVWVSLQPTTVYSLAF